MTIEELMSAIKGLSAEDRAALLGEVKTENTYRIRDLVEISFGKKPDKETREKLSKAKFHWNGFEKVWYAYYSDDVQKCLDELGIKKAA